MEPISIEKSETQPARKFTQQEILAEHRERQQKRINIPEKQKKSSVQNVIITILLIVILSGAGFFGWFYWWTTYATFEYKLQPVVILDGQHVSPDDFLVPGENMERITAVFRNPAFRPSTGHQEVQLTLAMGWRAVETSAPLYILTTINKIEHEYATISPEMKPIDFLTNASIASGVPFDVRFVDEPMQLEDYPVGEHTLDLTLNGADFSVLLAVGDTTPPEAVSVSVAIKIGEEVKPEDFVTNITDASDHLPIQITYYETGPDIFGHDQIIAVKVEDYYGNYTVVHAGLTVQHNKEPPVIEGTGTMLITIGDPILYMQGVTARDDLGRDLTDMVIVDSSDVNQHEAGVYTVRYRVVDFTGLSFEIEETIHMLDVDMEFVNDEVDRVLEVIIKDEMTQMEQVRAIFNWVRSNVSYALNRDRPETSYEGAYRALRERRGNCYVFYSISELLMTRAGIPNMLIERIPGTPTAHRWNLVNPDGLGWHHYDSFPARYGAGSQMAFFTDSQAREFTRRMANLEERPMNNYYTFDPERYPEIVQ